MREVYGHALSSESLAGADNAGETATRGLRNILVADSLDVPTVDAGLPDWCKRFSGRYLELLAQADTAHWQLAPEASEVLELLADVHRIALLTGNPEPVARGRLERLGLANLFPAGRVPSGARRTTAPS